MVGGRFGDRGAQDRQHGGEAERSAAIPVMRMSLRMTLVAALIVLALALNGGASCLVDMVMNGPVAVDVIVDPGLQSRDLLGDFIEAIRRDGTIRERQRNRRHQDARQVKQRHKSGDAASYLAGRDSKHSITALDQGVRACTRQRIVPARRPFGKVGEWTDRSPSGAAR
jgi:hypothetical protein